MGYETFTLEIDGWTLELKHNDIQTRVSITNASGVCCYMKITMEQAQQLKRHLSTTLPYEHGKDR